MTHRARNRRPAKNASAASPSRATCRCRLEQGARHALIGPNGAGKTTFINLLTGVLQADGRPILLDGADITALPVHTRVRRGLARTFQINQLFAGPDAARDHRPRRLRAARPRRRLVARASARARDVNDEIAEIAERFHLLDVMDERTATLPYGKQRLLEIAVAFACQAARAAARRAGRRRAGERSGTRSSPPSRRCRATSPCC